MKKIIILFVFSISLLSATNLPPNIFKFPVAIHIVVPNVFSPNGDGINDLFTIETRGVKTIDGGVYDRWGLKMFEWHGVNDNWDGRNLNGALIPEGTYFYFIKAIGFDDKEETVKGYLLLIR